MPIRASQGQRANRYHHITAGVKTQRPSLRAFPHRRQASDHSTLPAAEHQDQPRPDQRDTDQAPYSLAPRDDFFEQDH